MDLSIFIINSLAVQVWVGDQQQPPNDDHDDAAHGHPRFIGSISWHDVKFGNSSFCFSVPHVKRNAVTPPGCYSFCWGKTTAILSSCAEGMWQEDQTEPINGGHDQLRAINWYAMVGHTAVVGPSPEVLTLRLWDGRCGKWWIEQDTAFWRQNAPLMHSDV